MNNFACGFVLIGVEATADHSTFLPRDSSACRYSQLSGLQRPTITSQTVTPSSQVAVEISPTTIRSAKIALVVRQIRYQQTQILA